MARAAHEGCDVGAIFRVVRNLPTSSGQGFMKKKGICHTHVKAGKRIGVEHGPGTLKTQIGLDRFRM